MLNKNLKATRHYKKTTSKVTTTEFVGGSCKHHCCLVSNEKFFLLPLLPRSLLNNGIHFIHFGDDICVDILLC